MSESLSRKVGNSATLLFIRKIWSNLINLMVMVILARLLSKEDFGVLAISAVLLSFINTIGTSGLAEYLIYYDKKEDIRDVANSVFWLNLILTLVVCLFVLAAAPFWASFYGNASIEKILWLLLITFFFEMVSMVPRTLLRKDLEYGTLVKYSTVFMTTVSAGKLVGAYYGAGVFSLVLPQAIFTPILALAFFLKTGFRPVRDIGRKYYGQIIGYSKHLVGGRILSKLVNEGDNLIVGKLIGLEGLGVYNLAFQLANLVTTNIVLVVNDIVLPVLSKVKSERERLKKVFLDILSFLSILSFPLITALAVFAEPIIDLVYGDKWGATVLPLQILCLFAIGRSINSPSSLLYNAVGRPDIGFKFSLFFAPIFLVSVFLGSRFGIIGVATATSFVRFCGQLFSTRLAFSLVNITSQEFFKIVVKYLAISVALFGVISFLRKLVDFNPPEVELLMIPIFIYFYILLLRFVDLHRLIVVFQFLKQQRGFGKVVEILSKMLFMKV